CWPPGSRRVDTTFLSSPPRSASPARWRPCCPTRCGPATSLCWHWTGPLLAKAHSASAARKQESTPRTSSGSAAACQLPAVGRREVVECWLRAPRAGGIRLDGGRAVQQRCGDLPQSFDLVGMCEQGLVAEHGVQQEPLVALQTAVAAERIGVAEGHLGGTQVHRGAGFLGQEADRDVAGVVEVDDDLVVPPGRQVVAVDREHPQRRPVESERDHLSAGGQVLAGAQKERNPGPPPV